MEKSLEDRIKHSQLTKIERRVAEYFLKNESKLCFITSKSIAQALGVSETSIIRTTKTIGYSGFGNMKENILTSFLNLSNQNNSHFLTQAERMYQRIGLVNKADILGKTFNTTINNITKTLINLHLDKLEKVTDIILSSKNKYIIGFRLSGIVAHYLAISVGHIVPNVYELSSSEPFLINSLVNLTKKDCLFLISYPRHMRHTQAIIDIAKKRGAKIILLSDNAANEFAIKSDIIISTFVDGLGYYHSYITPLLISELISINIGLHVGPKKSKERMEMIENYFQKSHILIPYPSKKK